MRSSVSTLRYRVLTLAVPTVVALMSLQLGCEKMMFWRAKPQPMHSAADVPASQGTVRTTEGDNGNTKVSIRVKHLAPPSKMAGDATVYIVWIQPLDGEKQNVGALTLDNDLEGKLDTVTPHHRFQILVTPEPSGQVSQPSHEPVFTYSVENLK